MNCDGTSLHTIIGGEPDSPLKEEYQPKNDTSNIEEEPDFTFEYMFLGRLKSDLEYYFGYGNRNENVLYFVNVLLHVDEMKTLLNAFPKDMRPEWLTIADISNYESKLN